MSATRTSQSRVQLKFGADCFSQHTDEVSDKETVLLEHCEAVSRNHADIGRTVTTLL